jgi:Tfp pilus assembly pilus retraction ATPase PilT
MTLTPTIARLIREGKIWEMTKFLEESEMFGMVSFNQSLSRLVKDGLVTEAEAMEFADSKDELILALRGIKK